MLFATQQVNHPSMLLLPLPTGCVAWLLGHNNCGCGSGEGLVLKQMCGLGLQTCGCIWVDGGLLS